MILKNAPRIRFRVWLSTRQFSGNRAEIVNLKRMGFDPGAAGPEPLVDWDARDVALGLVSRNGAFQGVDVRVSPL
jgi:hypothetical protein